VRSRNHCAVEKQYLGTVQQAKRIRRVILSSVTCLVVQYVSVLSYKSHNIQKPLLNL